MMIHRHQISNYLFYIIFHFIEAFDCPDFKRIFEIFFKIKETLDSKVFLSDFCQSLDITDVTRQVCTY